MGADCAPTRTFRRESVEAAHLIPTQNENLPTICRLIQEDRPMPIPDFNSDGVLPPHLGDPTQISHMSPYPVSSLELCQKLGFSPERREILRGWLGLRNVLRTLGLTDGFQWLNGSFMEDAETRRGRSPGDIDTVTFFRGTLVAPANFDPVLFQIIRDRVQTKSYFKVDHLGVNLSWPGETIVEYSRYWCGLFSHRRTDGVWKGMLKVDLNTNAVDDLGRQHLDSLGQP